MSDIATIERIGAIGLIGLDNPPVNAASQALRQGLMAAMDALEADPGVEVIAIYGKGRSFIAGADIREFGKPPAEPWLPTVCNRIEDCAKPVLSVLHGAALGGGLEVAISTHARIAVEGVTIGFPEVTLGIIPGAGGTQRGPRLTGQAAALDLITTGRRIGAAEALEIGLVDRVRRGAPRDIALAAAQEVLDGRLIPRRTCEIAAAADDAALARTAQALRANKAHLFAPQKCAEAVAASTRPLAEGLRVERALFDACMASPQRAGLIHAFFAERAAAKIPEAGAEARDITRAGIVGAGTMGAGIATAFLLAGYPVTLIERDAAALARGEAAIAGNLDGAVRRGKLTAEARAALSLNCDTDIGALAGCDLVIEAVFEDLEIKQAVLGAIGRACPDAVIATNTSYIDINKLSLYVDSPENFIGLHFFSPAHVMRLLEVVVGDRTQAGVVATAFRLARRLGKIAVRAGPSDGFIGNRVMNHYRRAADYLMLDGAMPDRIDAAIRGFGFAMGPFETSDLAGLDIAWANRRRLDATRPATERYGGGVADRLVESGQLGRKTGRGFYDHGGATPAPNPALPALIAEERERLGIVPREISDTEIVARYLTAMISEAARAVEDGTALAPSDVDAVFLFGYGFPRWRGGPLFHADTLGPAEIVKRIEEYAARDAQFWQVPAILRRMTETGGLFADLNRER